MLHKHRRPYIMKNLEMKALILMCLASNVVQIVVSAISKQCRAVATETLEGAVGALDLVPTPCTFQQGPSD